MTLLRRIASFALCVFPVLAAAQPKAAPAKPFDLNGVWTSVTPPGTGGRWAIDTFSEKLPALTAVTCVRYRSVPLF
mgnify:CR=1 FL=1